MIEREKKFIVTSEKAIELKRLAIARKGIAQWYIIGFEELAAKFGVENASECRLRFIFSKGKEKWVLTFKSKPTGYERQEHEFDIENPLEILAFITAESPVVAKTRYVLLKQSNTEIELDEYIQLDVGYKVDFLVEVETASEFKEFEERFGLEGEVAVEEYEKYSNKNIAIKSNLPIGVIIEKVKNAIK